AVGGRHVGDQTLGVVAKAVGDTDHVHYARQVPRGIVFEDRLASVGILDFGDKVREIAVLVTHGVGEAIRVDKVRQNTDRVGDQIIELDRAAIAQNLFCNETVIFVQ